MVGDEYEDENQDSYNKEKENQFYSGLIKDNEKQKSESKSQNLSTIPNKTTTSALNTSEVPFELIRKNGYPYPNLYEILIIEFRNEKYFKSGEIISNYLNNINSFDDKKFFQCKNCNNNNNFNYCTRCKRNLCRNCSLNNEECDHELINLQNLEILANNDIEKIKEIIKKIYKEPKEENPKEKSQKIYDEKELDSNIHQIKNEISESIKDYEKPDDIELIDRIIGVNYIN